MYNSIRRGRLIGEPGRVGRAVYGASLENLWAQALKGSNPLPSAVNMLIKLYLTALPVFLAIDMVWLGLVARTFYKNQLGFLMKSEVNWPAAIIFYLLFIVGLVVFVINPALEKNSWLQAVILGGLFGLIAYATYDLTNLATLKNWPLLVTAVDLLWGTILAAGVSLITFLIAKK